MLVPEMRERGLADLLRGDRVPLRELVLSEGHREVAPGGEAGPHRGRGEGVDAPTFLPQIEGGRGELRVRLAERRHEIGAGAHQLAIERPDEFDVAVALVVLPQGPDRQTRLVLLDRELEAPFRRGPRVPRRAERAVGVVLVEKVALARHEVATEEEETARHLAVAGKVERIGNERAIARPEVRIR